MGTSKGTFSSNTNRPAAERKVWGNGMAFTATGSKQAQTPCLRGASYSASMHWEIIPRDCQAREHKSHWLLCYSRSTDISLNPTDRFLKSLLPFVGH